MNRSLRDRLPYRANVGAALFNPAGQVFVARRADLPNAEGGPGGWQLPQGGIDAAEDPAAAVLARTGRGNRHRLAPKSSASTRTG